MYLNRTDSESLDKYKKECLANLFEYVCAIDTLWLDLQGGILDGVGEIVKLAATYQTDISSYASMLDTDAIRLWEKRRWERRDGCSWRCGMVLSVSRQTRKTGVFLSCFFVQNRKGHSVITRVLC
ncbi:MAG: uncharacterized protein A8A55_2168 [Amphiamblys sp. WSBS2006]|nr:MAG: uncharacterized protein A8A55_2168 [Amphiamblys sp. WSBS2006]